MKNFKTPILKNQEKAIPRKKILNQEKTPKTVCKNSAQESLMVQATGGGGGGQHPVTNLKHLNKHIPYKQFKWKV